MSYQPSDEQPIALEAAVAGAMRPTDASIVLPLSSAVAICVERIVRYGVFALVAADYSHRPLRFFVLNLAQSANFLDH